MVRVALIAGDYQPARCGVAHYTARLRAALAARGVDTIVLTTHAAARSAGDPSVVGAVNDWGPADLPRLVGVLRRLDADVLHIQHAAGTYGFRRAIFLLPLLLKLTRWPTPIVTTVHEYGWWEWQPRGIPRPILERLKLAGQRRSWWDREDGFLLTLSDRIIATNGNTAAIINRRLPALADRVDRIPIGANVDVTPIERMVARQRVRRVAGWPDDALVIAFFGFLHPVKGLETLLPAFKQVAAREPRARLLLVGGVESLALRGEQAAGYWAKLQALVRGLGLTGLIWLTGYLAADAASHYLTGADLGVLPFNAGVTLKSGSLLTLFAHRLPVVATRVDPPDPDLHDGAGLRFVPPRDVDALADALGALLADPVERERLGAAGRGLAQRFSWSAIAEQHCRVYRELFRPS